MYLATTAHRQKRRGPSFLVTFWGLLSLIALAAGFLSLPPRAAHAAATFNVNSTGDGADSNTADNLCDDGSGNCTLRAAIQQANATSGADTIGFSVTGTINLTGALPDITDSLTVNGPGSSLLTVRRDTGGDYRIFTVEREEDRNALVVSISGLTVANGRTPDGFSHEFAGGAASGGGLSNGGTLTLTDMAFNGNSTGAGGAGSSFGGPGGSGGAIHNFGTLTLTNVTLTGNRTGAGGAGGNGGDGGNGGAISNFGGTLTMSGCVVRGNLTGRGGASNGPGGGDGGDGGGVSTIFGALVMTNCAVSENITGAGGSGGGGAGGSGSGIFSGHGATLTGVTVSNNAAGGGIYFDTGSSSLTNCTITANAGSGVIVNSLAPVVRNTIIAGNAGGTGPDVSGAYNSQGHNLIGNVGAASGFTAGGDQVGTPSAPLNPRLGPLADNGGTTRTHALLAGSPALDAGSNALALDNNHNALTTDQRGVGFARFADAADADAVQTVDIGAFEAHPSVETVADKATNPDTPLLFSFNVGDAALGISSVTAASTNQGLLPDSNLSISGDGSSRTLQITPAAGASGTTTITLTVTGSNNRSMSDAFVLSVGGVNAAPAFTKGADQTVAEDSGPQTIVGWATGISPGSPDEAGQSVSFVVTDNTNPGLFSAAPSMNPGGTLTFTPAPNANGSAVVTLVLKDNGGATGGGQDTSAPQTFNVNVTAVNDAPVNSVPVAQTTPRQSPLVFSGPNGFSVADVDAGTSPVRLTLSATQGTLTLGGTAGLTFAGGDGTDDTTLSFTGTLANVNAALNGLTFKPAQGFTGAASVQLTTDDQGNTGAGGAKADTDTVSISVTVVSGGQLLLFAPFETFESAGTVTFKVGRSFGGGGETSVIFQTSGGTAVGGAACGAGVDYVNASGTLTWADGETADKTFTVTLCDDSSHETDETFGVSLSDATGSAIIGTPPASVTIRDDDPSGDRIEFSQRVYTTGEDAGSLTVTVRRSGNTGVAAGVDYATDASASHLKCSDNLGLALERCDFTRAAGHLLFAAGETDKTFQILLSDDSYVEDTEVVFVRLSNPGGGFVLGEVETARLEITDGTPETSGNPVDDSGKFVRHHYHDFLNRAPDAGGLSFWTNEIESCGANAQCRADRRENVSAAFFLSIEFQETGFLVHRIYKAAFGDAVGLATQNGVPIQIPVPIVRLEEFLPDTQRISSGVIVGTAGWPGRLDNNKTAFAQEFVARSRFMSVFPSSMTPEQFVEKLNTNAGNVLSDAERANLIAELTANNTATGRASVLRKVAENGELSRRELNRAFVLMQFFGYLRRNPNDAPDTTHGGYNFWLQKLDQFNGNFVQAQMVKAFLDSAEYRQRFGQ
ncbi:MAG TPA: Calx-beta domain-containing protein [Pyrinomonadaceae bacterium]|nr:Calx-beta domain-containing protein [Pyrinomonadaceae bacterium]